MMTDVKRRFLIIDDDPLNNIISKIALKKSLGDVAIKEFLLPEMALEYIETEFENRNSDKKTTIFLDINMPDMSGWDFLKIFEKFEDPVKNQYEIYMLSSSVDPADIHRAKVNPLIIDFIEKPLNKGSIENMLS